MPGTFVFKPIEATIDNKANIGLHPENLDPYCKIKVGHVALSTHASRNFGLHPHWNEDLVVQQGEDSSCVITVKDKNKGTIGEVKLDLDEIEARGKVAQWFDISKDRQKQGQLMLEVVYTHANPQSKSFHRALNAGAAIASDRISVKGHASPSEIGPFRIYERPRVANPKNPPHHNHDLTEARHHLGANNIVAKYALEHMKGEQDHTGIKHEIAHHNAKVLNSGHKQTGRVVTRESVREEPYLSAASPITRKDQADVKVHVGHNNVAGRVSSALHPSPVTYAQANERIEAAQHIGTKKYPGPGYQGVKLLPESRHGEELHASPGERIEAKRHIHGSAKNVQGHPVLHATPMETAEARQHVVPLNVINPNTKKVTVIDTAAPVTTKDVAEVRQHVGNYNVNPQNGAFAGHSSLKNAQVRVQRDVPVTGVYTGPVIEDYIDSTYVPAPQTAGNARAGHASLKNAQVRVQRPGVVTGPTVVHPVPVEEYVEEVYDVTPQGGVVTGHVDNSGYVRVQRPVTGCSYTFEDPNENYAEVCESPVAKNAGYGHAGHGSLRNGQVRVQKGPSVAVRHGGIPQVGVVPGSNWVAHTHDALERESVASSCTSGSAYEGTSNPNNAGKSREYLRGLDRFNLAAEQEKCLSSECSSVSGSVGSGLKPGKKDDYWYLNQIGMSDPNTAKLGVNHSANRLGLVDQHHGHRHHHHHHHHHGHSHDMKDRVVYTKPTLADINSFGTGARVYAKHL